VYTTSHKANTKTFASPTGAALPSNAILRKRVDRRIAAEKQIADIPQTIIKPLRDQLIAQTANAVRQSSTRAFMNQSIESAVNRNLISSAQANELRAIEKLSDAGAARKHIQASQKLWSSNLIMNEIDRQLAVLFPLNDAEVTTYTDFGDAAQIIIGSAGLGASLGVIEGGVGALPGAILGGLVGIGIAIVAAGADNAVSGEDEGDGDSEDGDEPDESGDTESA
jgi:hypothetical protein